MKALALAVVLYPAYLAFPLLEAVRLRLDRMTGREGWQWIRVARASFSDRATQHGHHVPPCSTGAGPHPRTAP